MSAMNVICVARRDYLYKQRGIMWLSFGVLYYLSFAVISHGCWQHWSMSVLFK